MTEKTRLLKSAIDEIDRVLLGNKSPEVNEVYLNNAKRYIEESMTDHQPTFEVGEYYKCSDIIYRVTSVGGSQIKYAKFYSEANKFYSESSASLNSNFCDNSKPAAAEEIAEFKRAEIKNDIDFIIKDGDGDWIEIVENIEDYFQTAEELREVENESI